MKLELNMPNLKELDFGKVAAAFEEHLRRAAEDCDDRAVDTRPRIVNLKIMMKPIPDDHGDCMNVDLQCFANAVLPPHRSRVFQCQLRKGGILAFDNDSPDDAEQGTFGDLEEVRETDK